MSVGQHRIVRDGLVFAWDKDAPRSFAGPAITNLTQTITPNATSGTNILYTTTFEAVSIPTVGPCLAGVVQGINNNSGSYCCMNNFNYYNSNFSVSPSTTYTYGLLYKCTSGYTHPNFMYRYEFTSGAVYVTEAGVHDTAKRIHLGDGWYWAWNTFTTQSTTALMSARGFYYQYGVTDRWYVAKVLVVAGDYTNLHPSKWPDPAVARSLTTSVQSIVGNGVCSAGSLTYDNSGSPYFNGSSNYLTFNNSTALDTQTPSVEVWVKTNNTNQNGFWFEKGTVNTQYSLFQEGTNIQWRIYNGGTTYTNLSTTTASYMNTSNWYQVVGTYTSGSRILYINGVQVNSDASTGTVGTNAGGMTIGMYNSGGYYYNGYIASVKVYNKVLTPEQVLQNYNAQKTRFGY